MGIRKLCLTKKITVTTSEKLYSEIEQVCKNSMHFATISEYTAYAMEYFIDRFIDDVAPYVVEEQKRGWRTIPIWKGWSSPAIIVAQPPVGKLLFH